MNAISAGFGGGTRLSDRLNVGKPGSLTNRLGNSLKAASAAGVYRDIDNAFSAGGSDGNGSPQSAVVYSGSPKNFPNYKKKRSPVDPDGGSSGGSFHHTSAKKALKYYEAPLAEYYGFNKQTAYQEALANTSYRREMADMRKAGLNPSVIYGSHNSSGADSGILPREDSAGGYRGSGGAGGSGRRYRGGNSGKYVFSGGAYYGLMTAAAVIGTVATKSLGGGMAAAGIAGTAMKAINGFFKK